MTTEIELKKRSPLEIRDKPDAQYRRTLKNIGTVAEIAYELAKQRLGLESRYESHMATTPEEVLDVQQFYTRMCLLYGKVTPDSVDTETDVIARDRDPVELSKSHFFSVRDHGKGGKGDIVAAARVVWDPQMDLNASKVPSDLLNAEGHRLAEEIQPGQALEIGRLLKQPGAARVAPLKLFSRITRFGYDNNITEMVAELETRVHPLYKKYFGGAMRDIADSPMRLDGFADEYMPIAVHIGETIEDGLAAQKQEGRTMTMGERAIALAIRVFMTENTVRN